MSKAYSIEEIQRALELYEMAKSGQNLLDSFSRLMQFSAGVHMVEVGDERYQFILAMERLQELVDAGKSVTIQPSFIDGKREIEFVVCSRVEKFSGDWIRCIQLTIPEAILNLKVEE